MSWQASVDRVLVMRREAALEREKAELIKILQELEKRCQVVVNRQVSAVLKDVPSWKSQPGSDEARKQPRFRGGIRTWQESKRQLEKKARAGSDKLKRRANEFEQVLNGTFPNMAGKDVAGVLPEPAGVRARSGFHAGQRPAQKDEENSDGAA